MVYVNSTVPVLMSRLKDGQSIERRKATLAIALETNGGTCLFYEDINNGYVPFLSIF